MTTISNLMSFYPQALRPIALPLELIDALNQTFFLYLLANEPDKVIPPGKSLLSMLAHSHVAYDRDGSTTTKENLEGRIRQVAQKTFWDETFETLSSSQPSVQLKRLRVLYSDLNDALAPLFPLNHPPVQVLSSPLAPTTSPLHSAALLLRGILVAIKQRCAPARDQAVDELSQLLDVIPSHSVLTDPSLLRERNHAGAKVILKVVQSTLTLSEVMKGDLSQFVLGAISETQIQTMVRQQAKARERELVVKLWSASGIPGQQVIRESWRLWVEQLDTPTTPGSRHAESRWKLRLLQALQSTTPVSCTLGPSQPSTPAADVVHSERISTFPNNLPPQFLFTVPILVSVQNYMQALIITVALRSLLCVPSGSPVAIAANFSHRVWMILAGEIEANRPADIEETKIRHLVDELIRARRAITEIGVGEEQRLRTAADNLLRPEDPVYLLFQRRLVTALREVLFASRPSTPVGKVNRNPIPERMKTGKDLLHDRVGKRPRLDLNPDVTPSESAGIGKAPLATPKGFEDPVLALEVSRLSSRVASCVNWVGEVWGDPL